jgi:hypothetical protein
MTFQRVLRAAALIFVMAGMAGTAAGADYRYLQIDVPGATATSAYRINARGDVVGRFTDSTGQWGFLLSAGTFTTIKITGSSTTLANGINNRGDVVGSYSVGTGSGAVLHGFLLRDSEVTVIDVPDALGTRAFDISATGDVTGEYQDNVLRQWHGFSWRDGQFTFFDVSGSNLTSGYGINVFGDIVGHYTLPGSGKMYGYIYSNGQFTSLNHPSSGNLMSCGWGIGVHGEVVGHYTDVTAYNTDSSSYSIFGYLYQDGAFETLQAPGARETYPSSITPNGTIAGYFRTYDPVKHSWTVHGFVAAPLNPTGR